MAIVGAGPAGMSAAIYAVRKNLSKLIITSDIGGQLGATYEVGNYPCIQMITGPDRRAVRSTPGQGAQCRSGRITDIA